MKLCVFFLTQDKTINPPPLDKHYEWMVFTPADIPTYAELSKKIRQHHPIVFCSIGTLQTWKVLYELPFTYRSKWLHYNSADEIKPYFIENCYMSSLKPSDPIKNPLFSVITTTFHSGEKLLRPFQSLQEQTYRNWEWVVWDDSKADHQDVWNQLQLLQENDIRIKCYRDTHPSGFIGHMKWLSSSLSKGDWIVELDHDDLIHPKLFQWCVEAIKAFPDVDFICSSCVELFENNDAPFSYGDMFGFGYGHYQKQWLRGKWHNVAPVLELNPTTLRHIVGVPNHVRIWRRSFYEKIGRHQSELPVVDDYELLIRSFLQGNWVRIHAPGYYQYKNHGGNNFTYLRNSLIQHLSAKVHNVYAGKIKARWEELGFETNVITKGKCWHGDFQYSKSFIKTYVPNAPPLSICIPVDDGITADQLWTSIQSLPMEKPWWIYIIGNKSDTLVDAMKEVTPRCTFALIDRIRWWNLEEKKDVDMCKKYFTRMLCVTEKHIFAEPNTQIKID
jgi:glycosyltransferase involved in cell wall biosynthesis